MNRGIVRQHLGRKEDSFQDLQRAEELFRVLQGERIQTELPTDRLGSSPNRQDTLTKNKPKNDEASKDS